MRRELAAGDAPDLQLDDTIVVGRRGKREAAPLRRAFAIRQQDVEILARVKPQRLPAFTIITSGAARCSATTVAEYSRGWMPPGSDFGAYRISTSPSGVALQANTLPSACSAADSADS